MVLFLDHQQRLNLIAVLGAADVKGRELHAIWHLQDLLDLDPDEKATLEFREETLADGQKVQRWNQGRELAARQFEVPDADLSRVRKAIEDFPQFRGSRDRVWLEPLLAQLPEAAQTNGAAPIAQPLRA